MIRVTIDGKTYEANEGERLSELLVCMTAAGLEPKYETFDSIVQETERLEVTYGGKPVKALMIDNGAAAFVTDGPIEYRGNNRTGGWYVRT